MIDLSKVQGVGPKTKTLMNKIDIYDVDDLVMHIPFRYDVLKRSDLSNVEDDEKVIIDGKVIEMTSTQFKLLKLFLENEGFALSRDKIIECIWGYDYEADDRTVDAHIKLLRSKLGKYRDSIKTIRKVGYKFIYEER